MFSFINPSKRIYVCPIQMSTFIKSDQSAPNLLRASPISRSGFVHPDKRVITGLTCIYIENFKNLLVRNHWTNFNIILQKCSFGDPLPRLFKPSGFVKNMAARGQGLFSLYIYIEKFKNLLVRNHWTNFNIILQKCSFCDPLPRLYKPFGFVKKHGYQGGAGLIFPIYLFRKL